jgi:PAS domain S-box-containing protein
MAVGRHAPDLVLTDYRLPDGCGSELVAMAAGSWPVIMMTAHGTEQVAVDVMKSGAQDYIVKSPEAFMVMPHTVSCALKTWALMLARRQADEAFLQEKKDWKRTFDAVPDLIAIMDSNHTITRVNNVMAERCGVPPAELIGRKCCEVVHGLQIPLDCCPVHKMMRNGMPQQIEIQEKKLNGFFDITVSPLSDDGGRITGFIHVMRDITPRKLALDALHDSEEKHRKLSNEQRIILNCSSVGIAFVKSRKVVWANPAHDAIFGYEAGTTCGMDTNECYADPESYALVGKNGYAAIESGGIYTDDVKMKKKDGSLIWCNMAGQAVNPENREDGSIWVLLDITERKRIEEERLEFEKQLQQAQKLESLGVLAGGIAHDFNNILTVILGHCYLALEDLVSEHEYKAAFQQIETAGSRAADLCGQMLAYAGKSPRVWTRLNIWLLVDEVVKMLQSAFKKNVTIVLDLNRRVPEIYGDSAQIQQVVMNLIINAAEAIGTAKGTVTVSLTKTYLDGNSTKKDTFGSITTAGSYVCLEVSDNGCGMDEETRKKIFEPFYTTKITGRGLGMSAIHGIVTSHNGTLQLTSTPGVGTTFTVCFPLAEIHSEAVADLKSEIMPEEELRGTILLIEDELALRNLSTALLETMGFSVLTAQNGREGLEIYCIHGNEIDLILLDLIMPEMGGIETYHKLRATDPNLFVIICSGYGGESVAGAICDDPYAEFVHKPYDPAQLRCVIKNMMERHVCESIAP